jgi:uncharacterized membrane protein YphA (DoxX/SURF4 family)
VLLRLWAGAFFLGAAHHKLIEPGWGIAEKVDWFVENEYVPLLQESIASPPRFFGVPLEPFADFLRDVMLPGKGVFGPAILFGEAMLGVSLVLGLFVRLSASLGFLMMLCFSMARDLYVLTVRSANWPIALILLTLVLAAAGRHAGLDAWVRARAPRWLRWAA